MARVKRGVAAKKRHKKILEQAKGYYGNKSRSFRAANEQVMRSGQYAFRDRRARKGEFRRLWIQRINAACRTHGMSYSQFISGLLLAGLQVELTTELVSAPYVDMTHAVMRAFADKARWGANAFFPGYCHSCFLSLSAVSPAVHAQRPIQPSLQPILHKSAAARAR